MGLLRLMGNKADVVKGLAKRCNENWRVAPTSDIVSPSSYSRVDAVLSRLRIAGPIPLRYPGPFDHDDTESESLREDPFSVALELPRPDFNRNDGGEQPNQRCFIQTNGPRYGASSHEFDHGYAIDFDIRVNIFTIVCL